MNRFDMKKLTFLIAILILGTNELLAQVATGDVIIKNGTVLTITDGTLENTDVLVEDGKITRIGTSLRTPNGVTEVDAGGKFVMPGIIDAHSHIAGTSINEGTSQVTAEVQMGDVVNPLDLSIYRALAGGVTSIYLLHGSANVIGGESETLKLRYGVTDPEDMMFEGAPRTIKFALGENPTRGGRSRGIQPQSRMGVEAMLRNSLREAQIYKKTWEDYRADKINMLLNVFRDFGIKNLTFQHANEAYKVAPELAEFGAGASVFSDWWAYKLEVYYSTAYNAAILTNNGVTTSINSDSGELIRHLFHEAAKSQKYGGLTDEEALALITLNPAKQLGIDNRVGSIEEGKDGDIAIFEGHPLSVYAIPVMTFVDGVKYFDRETDADDQRLYVDPESTIEVVQIFDADEQHKCMQDAEAINLYEFLNN